MSHIQGLGLLSKSNREVVLMKVWRGAQSAPGTDSSSVSSEKGSLLPAAWLPIFNLFSFQEHFLLIPNTMLSVEDILDSGEELDLEVLEGESQVTCFRLTCPYNPGIIILQQA